MDCNGKEFWKNSCSARSIDWKQVAPLRYKKSIQNTNLSYQQLILGRLGSHQLYNSKRKKSLYCTWLTREWRGANYSYLIAFDEGERCLNPFVVEFFGLSMYGLQFGLPRKFFRGEWRHLNAMCFLMFQYGVYLGIAQTCFAWRNGRNVFPKLK